MTSTALFRVASIRAALACGALTLACGALVVASLPALANEPPKGATTGGTWNSTVKAASGTSAAAFDEKQVALITKVGTYFNALTTLQGAFQQTDPDKKTSRGKFYLKKPGQFRFDYARPSRKVIVSDGRFLAIQDHDLNTADTYELDNTPFRVLLKADVDLVRDAKVLEVVEIADTVVLTLQDKSPDTPGAIRLIMARAGEALDLKEWITYDAQGLETRVVLGEMMKGEQVDAALFKRESFIQKRLQNN